MLKMATTNSGAVFFLGTRAHYQVLTAPEQAYDIENGNASVENISNNGNEVDTIEGDLSWGGGVKRRLRKNRKQDGSSELILNDNDEYREYDPADLNSLEDGGTPKLKAKSRSRITVSHLLALLARRRRASDWNYCGELACSYRDSCRCLECQSRYFECDESDNDYDDYNEYDDNYESASEEESWSQKEPEAMDEGPEDDEVFLSPPQPETSSTTQLVPPAPLQRPSRALGLAAGAPALCDHLLSHPVACVIQ